MIDRRRYSKDALAARRQQALAARRRKGWSALVLAGFAAEAGSSAEFRNLCQAIFLRNVSSLFRYKTCQQ